MVECRVCCFSRRLSVNPRLIGLPPLTRAPRACWSPSMTPPTSTNWRTPPAAPADPGGYSGGAGAETKRYLLEHERAAGFTDRLI